MKVLIAGGSGMLGKRISQKLLEKGHEVAWLSRNPKKTIENINVFTWKPEDNWLDQNALEWADAIINLAGASIGETKWTVEGKKQIKNSRMDAVNTLQQGIQRKGKALEAFVGVSGVGIYGPSDFEKKETDTLGTDFPAQVAIAWEEAYAKIPAETCKHKSIIRLAVVLSLEGGALPKIMEPIKYGLGAALGSGLQAFNWIHINDAAEIFCQALGWDGVYNAAAPSKINNKIATSIIAKAMHRPLFLPAVPAFALRLFLGDRSQLVTQGNWANIDKLKTKGFQFEFPEFEEAVRDLIGN
jgi:uncharacterized protein (TIGR01777 family)